MEALSRSGIVKLFLLAPVVLAVSNCALVPPEKAEIRKELLNTIPLDLPRKKPGTGTLLVFPPETRPAYDTLRIAYTTAPYQLAYFSRHEWAETPSQMLQPLLIKTLENLHFFRAVLTPPYAAPYSHALRVQVLDLTQDFTSEPAAVQLSLRLQLSEGASNRVISTKEITLREPMQKKNPESGVAAANDAVAKALREIAGFLLEKIN
jgi:cholesterol transport system auxiliary component